MAKMVGTNKAYSMARSGYMRPPWGDCGYGGSQFQKDTWWLPGAVELWVSSVSENPSDLHGISRIHSHNCDPQ